MRRRLPAEACAVSRLGRSVWGETTLRPHFLSAYPHNRWQEVQAIKIVLDEAANDGVKGEDLALPE